MLSKSDFWDIWEASRKLCCALSKGKFWSINWKTKTINFTRIPNNYMMICFTRIPSKDCAYQVNFMWKIKQVASFFTQETVIWVSCKNKLANFLLFWIKTNREHLSNSQGARCFRSFFFFFKFSLISGFTFESKTLSRYLA